MMMMMLMSLAHRVTCTVCKCCAVTFLTRTPIFDCCVVGEVKDTIMINEIGLRLHFSLATPHSIVKTTGSRRTYSMYSVKESCNKRALP